MRKCKIENCNNKHHALGYCLKHYTQLRKHNQILKRTQYDLNKITDQGDYYEISLYNNKNIEVARAKIDKQDLNFIKDYKWSLDSYGYVKTKRNTISLHSLIIGKKTNLINNFINKDKLDNRRKNLRYFKGEPIIFNNNTVDLLKNT